MRDSMEYVLKEVGKKRDKERAVGITKFLEHHKFPYMIKKVEVSTPWREKGDGPIIQNIVVPVDRSSSCNQALYLIAHYDVVHGSNGYNDNGSGITILLHLIKFLYSLQETRYNVTAIFTDCEENGAMGIQEAIKEMAQNSIAINLDSCGYGDYVYGDILSEDKKIPLFCKIQEKIDRLKQMPPCDTSLLRCANIPTATICAAPDNFYHVMDSMHNMEKDNFDNINFDIMIKIYDILKEILM